MEVFVYVITGLPPGVNEMVTPCLEGYTVYISDRLDRESRLKAFKHALEHISNNDFEKSDVNAIETKAHKAS